MMRYILHVCLLIALLLSTAEGRRHSELQYTLNTGVTIPESPERFGRIWDPGPAVSFGLSLPVDAGIKLVGNLDYSRLALNNDNLLQESGLSGDSVKLQGGATNIFAASIGAKIRLIPARTSISPYVIAAVGLSHFSINDATMTQRDSSRTLTGSSETAASIGLGGGIDLALGERMTLFVEARYVNCYTETHSSNYVPVRVGLLFR